MQPPWVTLDRQKGSCRDFAVLMMEAARVLGIAARFVSGYIYVPHGENSRATGPRRHPRMGAGLTAGGRLDRGLPIRPMASSAERT